jgi:peptide/nickel transport system substrate-binding protein
VFAPWFHPIDRIGVVGDFTPSTLPLSIQDLISMGLTSIAADGSAVPSLASSWEATNSGKTYVFTLRNDRTWQGGRQVTAHDINYNIRGVTLIPTDNNTLMAYLQYPYSPFPTLVSKPIFLPGLKGFGSYEVSGIHLQGDSVRSMELTPLDISKENAKEFTFYQTEEQAILSFKLGEVNELLELSTPSGLAHWGDVKIEKTTKYNRIVTLFYNMRDQRLQDKNLRQGLAYGVPELPNERAISPLSKTSWAYTENIRKYEYDPVQAKKLIDHTQIGTGSAELTLSTFSQYLDVAQAIAQSWTSLGVKTNVRVENDVPSTYQVLLSAQDVPPDPDQYLFWHSTQSQTNVTGYVNVKIDKLLEDGRQEVDQKKRKTIYADFQRRLVEDAPAVFLYYPVTYTIKRK